MDENLAVLDAESVLTGHSGQPKSELRLWLRLLSTTNLISTAIRRNLRLSFNVTLPQFDLLAQLEREPNGLRLGELSQRMMVTNGNVTALVDKLVEQGFILREASPEDRRAIVVRMTRAVLPGMIERGFGRIINVASTAGLKGYPYVSAYVAAKHAVIGLTRALALETAKLGVTVNALCPGYTDTELVRSSVEKVRAKTGGSAEAVLAELTAANPQARLVAPREVAAAAVFLASREAGSVNGQAIAIDGGETVA